MFHLELHCFSSFHAIYFHSFILISTVFNFPSIYSFPPVPTEHISISIKVTLFFISSSLDLFIFSSHSFPFIHSHRCPTDQTLNYKFSIDKEQRFSFEAFRFTQSKDSSEVYLHCEVIVCHKDNNASRCNQACSKSDRPRYLTRRDITTRETEEIIMNDNLTSLLNMTAKLYDVSLGPLKVYIDPIRKGPIVQGTMFCVRVSSLF